MKGILASCGGTVSRKTGQTEGRKTESTSGLNSEPNILHVNIILSTCEIHGDHQGLPLGECVSFGPTVGLEEQAEGWSQSGRVLCILHRLCCSVRWTKFKRFIWGNSV